MAVTAEIYEVRCMFCGKKEVIDEDHRDYERFVIKPKTTYVCVMCRAKLEYEAREEQKPAKPI